MGMSRLALSILIGGPAATAYAVVPDTQVPPIVVGSVPSGPRLSAGAPQYRQVLVTWNAREVRCAGVPVAFVRQPAVMPILNWAAPTSAMKSVEFGFTIDPVGRPIDIKRLAMDYVATGGDRWRPSACIGGRAIRSE